MQQPNSMADGQIQSAIARSRSPLRAHTRYIGIKVTSQKNVVQAAAATAAKSIIRHPRKETKWIL